MKNTPLEFAYQLFYATTNVIGLPVANTRTCALVCERLVEKMQANDPANTEYYQEVITHLRIIS